MQCPCEKHAENADIGIEISTTCIGQLWIVHALKLKGMEALEQLKATSKRHAWCADLANPVT